MTNRSHAKNRLDVLLSQLNYCQKQKVKWWINFNHAKFSTFIKKVDDGSSLKEAYAEAKKTIS